MLLIWENILLAINSLLSNKMRALLTMLGIIIGIGSVIAIITVGDSLTLSVSENMQSMGANDVYAMVQQKSLEEEPSEIDGVKFGSSSSYSYATEDDYITEEMIKEMCDRFSEDIYAINLQYSVSGAMANKGKSSASINISGNSVGYFVTNKLTLISGHMFSEEDFEERKNVTIVSDKLVNKLYDGDYFRALGQELEVTANGKTRKVYYYWCL